SRLVSLLKISLKWYAVAAVLFVVVCGPGGAVFLARGSLPLAEWFLPWSVLVLLTGGLLAVQPLTAILEGCDQLKTVNQYRFRQAVFGTLVVWAIIGLKLGLWAAAGSAAVRLGWELHLVGKRYGSFFYSFRQKSVSTPVVWKLEIFPLLWRLGIQGIATWWALQTLIPVIFEFHGDIEGGRMGMTWTVLIALQSATASWVDTRRPKFGQLIATGEFEKLNSLFSRCLSVSMVLLAVGCSAFCGVLMILPHFDWTIAQKLSAAFIAPEEAAILAFGILLFQIPAAQSIYVRAFKVEPFLVPSMVVCSTFAMSVFYFGKNYGVVGAATAWTCVVGVIQVPVWSIIWMKTRRRGLEQSARESGKTTQPH
ncbi:MAG: hypothetical protein ACKVHE_36515, partial [Planctomycetales bacterium]